jgi:hypothetical protein
MTKNKIAYAFIAGILAIGITSAFAEPEFGKFVKSKSAWPGAGVGMGDPYPLPEIQGTVDVGKDIMSNDKIDAAREALEAARSEVGNDILSKAKIGLAEATATAEAEGKGIATSGNLGIQSGYLIYTFTVVSENQARKVIVDAGSGDVLHVSEPMPHDVLMLISGQRMHFEHAVQVLAPLGDKITLDEQE